MSDTPGQTETHPQRYYTRKEFIIAAIAATLGARLSFRALFQEDSPPLSDTIDSIPLTGSTSEGLNWAEGEKQQIRTNLKNVAQAATSNGYPLRSIQDRFSQVAEIRRSKDNNWLPTISIIFANSAEAVIHEGPHVLMGVYRDEQGNNIFGLSEALGQKLALAAGFPKLNNLGITCKRGVLDYNIALDELDELSKMLPNVPWEIAKQYASWSTSWLRLFDEAENINRMSFRELTLGLTQVYRTKYGLSSLNQDQLETYFHQFPNLSMISSECLPGKTSQ